MQRLFRGLILALTLFMLALWGQNKASTDVNHITGYIDTGRYYTNGDTLTADGYSDTIAVVGAQILTVQIDVAALGDTAYVILEGSKDGVGFFNTDVNGDSLILSATGTSAIIFPYAAGFRYYRLWMQEASDGAKIVPHFSVGARTSGR